MSSSTEPSSTGNSPLTVTPELLRGWTLPPVADSKYGRGQVVVVGGALRSPGAAMLAGIAALRVGAGRLTLAVGASVAPAVAVAVMEAGVVPLGETADGHIEGAGIHEAADDLAAADVVVVGPGLDDADEARSLLTALVPLLGDDTLVLLDAYALGVLPALPDVVDALRGRLVLTPNKGEAARLLERDPGGGAGAGGGAGDSDDVTPDDVREIARRYGATVTCYGTIADPSGSLWLIGTGTGGLATSGSGDVLAGTITGLLARGADPARATVWATHVHAVSGDRLAVAVGPLGYLAGELLDELPRVLVEIGA
ncbi:NAD(P)H-hydrate dehydratase [Subtercola sp. Z020]|uniref:ADP-dependent NAD(P)H-hydrate dehydratase n=1 Tax=Subtercola sp. Z020 TaxID=2080582 RepID=UPI000CE79DDE|nr:ADP/ATP-dependent (S)-NAD(P)H-hydrate dehydratase [Subtercola sp. Z020]PPF79143.1 NAD(P)H-hydrate dehydratase [Subtercola sp. Z020]